MLVLLNSISSFLIFVYKIVDSKGKINGEFSTANWSPIRYIYGSISQVRKLKLINIERS